ncbi:MAG: Fic family protein [Methylobacteriaceae bacterium]|jgi:Fic family protein|nr:Fic family protein [Methylobacteriaceae bacterium]
MEKKHPDIPPDMDAAFDRGESVGMMEPMIVSGSSPHRAGLADLALELAEESAAFHAGLPVGASASLADLVRGMNCYYSNLIEGHNTHPVDIERALRNDYSNDIRKRDLQLEAKAHIAVQQWIDGGGVRGRAATVEAIREIHRRFCSLLPPDLLWVSDADGSRKRPVSPGELRKDDVRVGRHVAISPGAVPRFLSRFAEAYTGLGRVDAILAAASAHHRLLWIHPFPDGNGRVARLMTHAMLSDVLDTGAVWSVARGLAHNEARYKAGLAACDTGRRNDLDGRGTLSEEELAAFTRFFLETCLDQVRFMRGLVEPGKLRARILAWAEEETRAQRLPPKAGAVLEAVLYRGNLPRADVQTLVGSTDRHARRITSALVRAGVLTADNDRAPFRLAWPARLAARWMPGLFPEKTSG